MYFSSLLFALPAEAGWLSWEAPPSFQRPEFYGKSSSSKQAASVSKLAGASVRVHVHNHKPHKSKGKGEMCKVWLCMYMHKPCA
jgi:hypothetical protein